MTHVRQQATIDPRVLIEALRPRQWVKNLLVVAAPAAATALDEPGVAAHTVLAFAAFTLAAGATYLGNDATDAAIDRLHPTRRHRPVASGRLATSTAFAVAAALAAAALIVAWLGTPAFALVIAIYLAVNVAYSSGLKKVPVLELVAVASGFALRAAGGGAATGIPLSAAFVVVVSAVSLVIVSAKRSAELTRTEGVDARVVLRHYSESGLRAGRAAAAMTAVVAYAIWVFTNDAADDTLATVLAALSLLAFTGALAAYEHAVESGLGEDPEEILLRDRALQVLVAAWILAYGTAIHV